MRPEPGDMSIQVGRENVAAAAREVGIVPGDTVMFHSSLSSMETVVGGPDAVIDGLLDAVSPEGTVAADHPECLRIVRDRVKPERDRLGEKGDTSSRGYSRWWWQHGRNALAMQEAIGGLDEVLVIALTSRTLAPTYVSTRQLLDQSIVVFRVPGPSLYAVPASSPHRCWALRHGSSMRTHARYTATDCFETFPLPTTGHAALATLGAAHHEHRRRVMLDRWEGLTKTQDRLHDPREAADDIRRLRGLQLEMDHAVAAAYGWTDLELGHGFRETTDGVRYTIGEPARQEFLSRLLRLNHERHAEEVARGLHGKTMGRGDGTMRAGRSRSDG